jgi:uncharacterized membrane protein YkvA (DUF1232 family)
MIVWRAPLATGARYAHLNNMEKSVVTEARLGEILKPVSPEENTRREKRVRDNFWRTARKAARHVPFMEEVVAAYFAALDSRTPTRVRGTLLAALAYFVMPIDLVPDFIVGFGFTDDLAVLTAAVTAIQGHIKPSHRKSARAALQRDEA